MPESIFSPRFESLQLLQAVPVKKRIDFDAFAREWNGSADGKTRQYVTGDVLSTYSKTWEKISNIRASQDLIAAKIDLVRQTGQLFSASTLSFPSSLKGNPTIIQPQYGVIALDNDQEMLDSISVGLANSHPRIAREFAVQPSNSHQPEASATATRKPQTKHDNHGPSLDLGSDNLGYLPSIFSE
jgi:hypothetical protein